MRNILDPSFRYTSAAKTDVKRTFRRVRRELQEQAEAAQRRDAENQAEAARIVLPILRRKT